MDVVPESTDKLNTKHVHFNPVADMASYEQLNTMNERELRRKNRAILQRFLEHGPYTYENFRTNKMEMFKKAFSHQFNVIYDKNASKLDKLREVLLSPQLNLLIIVLIVIDWNFAVVELITDIIPRSKKNPSIRALEQTIAYFSLAILGFFLVEVFLKIVLVPKYFFSSKLEVFDAIIVIASFSLEVFFAVNHQEFEGVGSVLTIFRFWRILRIINRNI